MTVLKGMVEIEMCCLNSRENFKDNKRFLRTRFEQEKSLTVRKLLEADLNFIDRIQVQMATAREFLIFIRLKDEKQKEIFPYLNRIHDLDELCKLCSELSDSFKDIADQCSDLTAYGVQPRYPMELMLEEQDMRQTLNSAAIRDFVLALASEMVPEEKEQSELQSQDSPAL